MLAAIRWLVSKIAAYWDAISAALGWAVPLMTGVLSGWAAWAADIFPRYSPFSFVAAGILGAALGSSIVLAIGWLRYAIVKASAVAKWRDQVDALNPLDQSFHSKRILLTDMVHPFSRKISNKRFTQCELIGPANIALLGTGRIYGVSFHSCDVVVTKPGALVSNVIALENVDIIEGSMWQCTIFIPPEVVPKFMDPAQIGGANRLVTLTGIEELDKPQKGNS